MDSSTLFVICVTCAIAGAIIAAAGVAVGYRLGRRATITHDGIRQAREVRDRIVAGILADGAVSQTRIADGAVTLNRLADGAVQEPFIFKLGARPIKPS